MLSEWPRIQQALRRHRPDIGYVTLSLYGGNGGTTETVGRLDFDDRHLRHWLEHGVADDSEDQLMDVLAALGRSIPSQDPDDEYQIKSDDDADDDEDDDGADNEESEEDDEESEEPEEEPVPPLSNSQVEAAVRRWLTTTCEQNCLDAGEASFRVRVYAHGGVKQLWSTLLRYQSTAAPPRPPASSPSPAPAYTPASPPPAPSPLTRSPQMSHPPGNNGSGGYPSPLLRTPSPAPQRPEQRSHSYAENFTSQPQTGGIHAAEVETLHMVHGLIRSFAASVLNTAKEQQQVYQRIIGELAGSLSDARQHNTDLIAENNQVQRARMEQERELLEQTDKSRVKESLGREGLQQAGALIRAVIQAQAQGARAQGPRAQGAPAPTVEGPTQYPEVDDDGNVITSEPSEEQLMALSQWLHSRPDVVDTLLDGSVQEYLRNPENVEQLRGLAAVMAGSPAESTPENTDNG